METKEQPTPDLSQADIDWAVTFPAQRVEQIKEYWNFAQGHQREVALRRDVKATK